MKKRYYLVQIGVTYSSPCFLPYSVGCIAAYLKNDPEITKNYEIPDILVMREPIEEILKRFVDPDFVAFSCFIWNYEYNKKLAQALKARYPRVKIIFAGHNVGRDGEILDSFSYVDFLMHNEGEESSAAFLKAMHDNTPLEDVPNLSFRKNGRIVRTPDYCPQDLKDYPSPYLSGVFDNILKEFPQIEFHATLETNRGCPYTCAYCEWCFTKKIRCFPMEKIQSEIEWIAKHHIRYCYCADANFGILERDVSIAKYVVEQKEKYGYPQVFKPCYAKESDDRVFEAGYLLNKNNADKGVTLAYQTLHAQTLENIGRKNLTLDRFSSLYRRYTDAGIPTYTELILGLPGETLESFKDGICSLLESGQDNSMTVYECQVYPNARMADKAYRKQFGIRTSVVPLFGIHYNPNFNGVKEYLEIVTQTASMSKSEWVEAFMFSVVLQTFHHLGLLRFFALYLHREQAVSYVQFYSMLYAYIYSHKKGFLFSLFRDLYARKEDTQTADWTYQRDIFGETGWYFEEGAFLELVFHQEQFWQEIEPFLRTFQIEESLFRALLVFQKSVIRTLRTQDVRIESDWNFYNFFIHPNDVPLKQVRSVLKIHTDKCAQTWADYAREFVWFGKRYSATLLLNPRERIEYEETDG